MSETLTQKPPMAFGQRPRTESIWMRNVEPDLFSP
jgi:hypothetical protein